MPDACRLCLRPAESHEKWGDSHSFSCKSCGKYRISGSAWEMVDSATGSGSRRFLLSAATRSASDAGSELFLTADSIPRIMEASRPPATLLDGIDRIVLWIADRTDSPIEYVNLADRDYPIVAGREGSDLAEYMRKARELGLIEWEPGSRVRLDVDGWERVQELRRVRVRSDQAFVAMWFDKKMDEAWRVGIEPALRSLGYRPVRVDHIEHNEKIDDRIIAELRRSGLVVADFTGHRGGVYFEAGYAMGLGTPVVWTCHAQHVDSLHFDTRQYSHVVWESAEELGSKLKTRIEATVPWLPRRTDV